VRALVNFGPEYYGRAPWMRFPSRLPSIEAFTPSRIELEGTIASNPAGVTNSRSYPQSTAIANAARMAAWC
jgi:hypothetical protein